MTEYDQMMFDLAEMMLGESAEYVRCRDAIVSKYQGMMADADGRYRSQVQNAESGNRSHQSRIMSESKEKEDRIGWFRQQTAEITGRLMSNNGFKKRYSEGGGSPDYTLSTIPTKVEEYRDAAEAILGAKGLKKTMLKKDIENAVIIARSLEMSFDKVHGEVVREREQGLRDNESLGNTQMSELSSSHSRSRDEIASAFESELAALDNQTAGYVKSLTESREYRASLSLASVPKIGSLRVETELDGIGTYDIPVCLDRYGTCSYCVVGDSDRQITIQNMIGALLKEYGTEKVRIFLADLQTSGLPYSPFVSKMGGEEGYFGKVATNQRSFEELLGRLVDRIDDITQKLSPVDGISSLRDLNTIHEADVPSAFLFIISTPTGISRSSVDLLSKIVRNGHRCGVHVVLSLVEDPLSDGSSLLDPLLGEFTVLVSSRDGSTIVNNGLRYRFVPTNYDIHEVVSICQENLKKQQSREIDTGAIIPPESQWMSGDSSESLTIPIGVTKTGPVSIELGTGTTHHVLIAGNSGSGKTGLLHSIITSACVRYDPDELNIYLLDFKEGVEFADYDKHRVQQVKLISLSCVQEFAENIFRSILDEIQRRSNLLKSAHVSDLKSYRALGNSMPRLLVIIDEFQFIFDSSENPRLANSCAALYDKIVRIGRSFGVHTIMATQNVSALSNSSLQRGTLQQLVTRILLGRPISEPDAQFMLSDHSGDVKLIDRNFGTGVINYTGGSDASTKFDVAWIPPGERGAILDSVHDMLQSKGQIYEAKMYDLNESPSTSELVPCPEEFVGSLVLGKSLRIDPQYASMEWKGEPGDNLLVLCTEKEQVDLTDTVLKSFLADASTLAFIANSKWSGDTSAYGGRLAISGTADGSDDALKRAIGLLDMRKSANVRTGRILVIVNDPTMISGVNIDAYESDMSEVAKGLIRLLESGPMFGFCTILTFNSMAYFKRVSRSIDPYASHRLAGEVGAEAVSNFIGTGVAVGDNEFAYRPSSGTVSKIIRMRAEGD